MRTPIWIRVVELAAIALVALIETLGPGTIETITAPVNGWASIALLAVLAVSTLLDPPLRSDRTVAVWIGLEFALVALSSAFGVGRLFDVIYMAVAAKAGLRIKSLRPLVASLMVALVFFLGAKELHYFLTQPSFFYLSPAQHITHVLVFGRVINQALQMSSAAFCTFAFSRELQTRLVREQLNAQIAEASAKLERTRMSRDIHDSVGHLMTSICMQLDFASAAQGKAPEKASKALLAVTEMLGQLSLELRRFSDDPRGEFDFSRELAELIAGYKVRAPFVVEWEAAPVNIPPHMRRDLFNVVKESLHNVEKYAGAKQVFLSVREEGGVLFIEVKDDGVGFDPGAVGTERYGLRGMRERLAQFGGDLLVESAPGSGTSVKLTVRNDGL